jgi:hypothetical protein
MAPPLIGRCRMTTDAKGPEGHRRPVLNPPQPVPEWLRRRPHLRKELRIVTRVALFSFQVATIAVLVLIVLLVAWPLLFGAMWGRLRAPMLESVWWRFLGVGCLGLVALGLYLARRYYRVVYGMAEIAIGLAACWAALGAATAPPLVVALTLASGVYVIVRGVDNAVVGWVLPKAQPFKEVEDIYRAMGERLADNDSPIFPP